MGFSSFRRAWIICLRFMMFLPVLWGIRLLIQLVLQHIFQFSFQAVKALKLPFLHNFKYAVSSGETCFYGYITRCLAQAQQESSLDLSQLLTSMRDGKAKPKASFQFNVKNLLCLSLVLGSWQKSLAWTWGLKSHQGCTNSSGCA